MTLDTRQIVRYWGVLLAVALIASSLVASGRADYTVAVTSNGVTAHISGDFAQGLPSRLPNTTARAFGDIPVFSGRLSGGNATFLQGLVDTAVSAKTRGASVADLSFSASSNSTLMHYDIEFTVNGISTSNNDVATVDLAWRSFAIGDDFGIMSTSINKIFQSYLEQALVGLAQATSSSSGLQVTTRFFMNGQFVPFANVVPASRNAVLLNFSSLSLPLQRWNSATQLPGLTTRLQSTTGFNLTLVKTVTEAGESASVSFNAVNKLKATIESPLSTTVSDDEIRFEVGSSSRTYEVMLTLPVAGLALFFSSSLWERHIQKRPARRGRKGKS